MNHIAIIGGGITGVTTAYALVRRGYTVTLFDRNRYAAMETSFANGGQLSASNAEVWNHWPMVFKGMKWMFRSDAPLLVNPKPSWHKLSWFLEFIGAIPQYGRNTTETARMAIEAREFLFSWAERENIDFDVKRKGILHIYRNRAGYRHAEKVSKLLTSVAKRTHDLDIRWIVLDDVRNRRLSADGKEGLVKRARERPHPRASSCGDDDDLVVHT